METADSYKIKPLPSPTEGTLSTESLEGLYKRLRQGAWVRSGASVFMWVFGLIAYSQEMIDRFAFLGISVTVLHLILINPPTLWILKGIRQKITVAALSLCIHGLEIFGYTAIIYFAGGMGRGYLTLLYAALITYVGVMSPRSWPFIVTAACTLSLSGVIALEYFKLIPDTALPLRQAIPYSQQLLDVAIMTAGFLVVAFISSYTSGLLRRGRQEMKRQNQELRETRDRIEQARHTLEEKNQALERATERAQSSDRKKSEFLSNMSHELRTPLNHIIGFSEMLCDRAFGELNPTQEEILGDVLQSSRHLLSLINEVLDLSKVEAGKMELKYSRLRIEELVENSLVVVKERAWKHRITVSREIRVRTETIEADELKLKQILYNLLSNAVKFTPDGGTVRVLVESENGGTPGSQGLRFSVIDTGIGLKAEDLERIFQPFEQADNSACRRYQGTGLGLSLTKHLVELHGGRIWAERRAEGPGAVFCFTIPVMPAGEAVL